VLSETCYQSRAGHVFRECLVIGVLTEPRHLSMAK